MALSYNLIITTRAILEIIIQPEYHVMTFLYLRFEAMKLGVIVQRGPEFSSVAGTFIRRLSRYYDVILKHLVQI